MKKANKIFSLTTIIAILFVANSSNATNIMSNVTNTTSYPTNIMSNVTNTTSYPTNIMSNVTNTTSNDTANTESQININSVYESNSNNGLTFKLIDGDLTNDDSLTKANVQLDDVFYFYNHKHDKEGPSYYYIILEPNSRVTIDYNHEVFKYCCDGLISGRYEQTLDPSKTRIRRVNGNDILEIYSIYTNSSGEVEEALCLSIELLTTNIDKDLVLFYDVSELYSQANEIIQNDIIKLNSDMTVAEAKKELEGSLIKTYTSEMTYINYKGKIKKTNIKIKSEVEIGHPSERQLIIMGDQERVTTGSCIIIEFTLDNSTFPNDLTHSTTNESAFYIESGSIEIACTGDITKTGDIDFADLSTMQEYLVDSIELEKVQEVAADMNDDDNIDVVDLSRLQEYIVKNKQ